MKFENTEVMNFEGAFRGMRNPMNSWNKSDSSFGIFCEHEENEDVYEVAHAWVYAETKDMADCDDICEIEDQIFEERLEWLYKNGLRYMSNDHHYYANYIGPNDMGLAKRLIAGGNEHRKFLRQIMVSVDITAPLYWWKEFDTYKVGTTANSTSTMHKLASTPITLDCFETDDLEKELPIGMWAIAGGEDYVAEPDYTKPIQCGNMRVWDDEGNEEFYEHYYPECTREDFKYIDTLYSIINVCERLRQLYLETKDKRYWKELVRLLPNGWLQTRTVTMNYENLRSMYHQREYHKLTEWHSFRDWVKTLPYAQELIID